MSSAFETSPPPPQLDSPDRGPTGQPDGAKLDLPGGENAPWQGTRTWAVLFDWDDTLCNSMPFRIRSWEHALRQCGQPIPDLKTFLAQTVGEPLEQQMERLSGPALAPALIAAYRAYYYTHHLDHLALYPGVYVAVQRLHDLGAAIAVVSSKLRAGVAEEVRALGLAPYVTLVVGPEDTPRPKPDPAPARFALQRLGVPAERALFVGDSPLDIYCGRAAGTRTIGALWGCHDRDYLRSARPDYEAESPAEVVAIASGLFVR